MKTVTAAGNVTEAQSMLGFDNHLIYFEDALAKYRRTAFDASVESWDCALEHRESAHARWNRGQARLSLGDYGAFADDFQARWALPFELLNADGQTLRRILPRWVGGDIRGKRLVVVHEMGFGDTLMLLRFVPRLAALGAEVSLEVPAELSRLAAQLASVTDHHVERPDLWVPMFDLMAHLEVTPPTVPALPYLEVLPEWRQAWRARVPLRDRRRVGIAWSQGRWHAEDFQRAMPLETMIAGARQRFADEELEFYSLQKQGLEDALRLGVRAFEFRDFADVAALASLMDEIICVDTAAVHVAGAIGHPNVTVMLPYLSSWRWLGERPVWYPWVQRCQQTAPGDWASAFAQFKRA